MRWHAEQWVKLYRAKAPDWLLLSVSARGLGRELLTYVDERGRLPIGGRKPGDAVALILGALPREHKRIANDVKELLDNGYLMLDGDALVIRNFVEAQDRTPGAKRTAEWRRRQNEAYEQRLESEAKTPEAASRETSHVTSPETSPVTSRVHHPVTRARRRSDPIRSDEELLSHEQREVTSRTTTTTTTLTTSTEATSHSGEREPPAVPDTPAEAILAELRKQPKLACAADRATAEQLANHVEGGGARLEDVLESLRAAAFDLEAGATEPVTRRAIRCYVGKAKVYGARRRADAAAGRDPEPDAAFEAVREAARLRLMGAA